MFSTRSCDFDVRVGHDLSGRSSDQLPNRVEFSTRSCDFDVSKDDSKEKAFQGKHNAANVSITAPSTLEHKIIP